MYQKYSTDALVLGSRERGEADRVHTLYTRDFGLVRARASAVRSERSRMRYALQNYSYANVSLVRGKRGWRVAGGTALRGAASDVANVAAFARIAELAVRLLAGEEENAYLFAALAEAHEALMQDECPARSAIFQRRRWKPRSLRTRHTPASTCSKPRQNATNCSRPSIGLLPNLNCEITSPEALFAAVYWSEWTLPPTMNMKK